MRRHGRLLARTIAALLVLLGPWPSTAGPRANPTRIRLQLKWQHQFQFAGYYAALEAGDFARAGLEVELIEGRADAPPLPELLAGHAEFAVSDADGLVQRMKGAPLVAVAAIFQHSPYVLLTLRDRGIRTPADLVGRRVTVDPYQGGAQVRAMLLREGIEESRVTFLPHEWNLDALVEGRADAISAYSTVEPGELRKRGLDPVVIDAADYGVDFYGDTLYTTRAFAEAYPLTIDALVGAMRQGWKRAFDAPGAWADHILRLPGVVQRGVTREQLLAEASAMRPLVLPDVVEIGHMNRGRWQRIAETYVELGLAPAGADWSGFMHVPLAARPLAQWFWPTLGALVLVVLLAVAWTLQLRAVVRRRTRELEQEVVQRRRVDEELRVSEARYRELFNSARDLIFTLKTDGVVESLNAAFEGLLGGAAQQWVGRHVGPLVLPKDLPEALALLSRAASGERPAPVRLHLVDAAGSAIPLEITVTARRNEAGEVVGLAGVARDVREREALEEQLRQSQKMGAVGRLAGGVAHDLNNVLTVIGMNAQLLRGSADPDAREAADEVEQAAGRGAAMVRQLLAFSRRSPMEARDLDLNDVVRDLGGMLAKLIGEDVNLQLDLSPTPLALHADAGMLEQVLLNLAVNARDAMPAGGRLVLRTRGVQAAKPGTNDTAGAYARLDVEDEGVGIDPAVMPDLFVPFFTTKAVGKGSGLGLSTAYGIAERHKGWISVDTAPGHGSTFSVFFPLRPSAIDVTSPAPPVVSTTRLPPAEERVLLVEDDAAVRRSVCQALEQAGWRVASASDGPAALALLENGNGGIGVVVTDLVMPGGLGGVELARRIGALRPGVPVIIVSGYPDGLADDPDASSLGAAVSFLAKPYTLEALVEAVRRALSSRVRVG